MKLEELRWLNSLFRNCNISATAEEHFITQSALSQCLQRVEREVGFPLFERSNKGLRPTEKGMVFSKAIARMLKAYADFEQQIYLMDCMDTNMTLLSYQVIQMLYLIEGLNRDQYLKMIELNRKEKSIISMEEMEMEIPYESPYILKDNPKKRRILIDRLKQLKEHQELMQVMPPLNKTTYQWYSKIPLKPLEVLYPMIYQARY